MKRNIKRLARSGVLPALCLLFVAVLARGQQPDRDADALLKAMRDEMARSTTQLKFNDLEKPYFIEYAVTEEESFGVSAAFGALVRSTHNRGRALKVQVRVGSYDLDNGDFISQSDFFSGGSFPTLLVIDDDYNALRHDLWLATDIAYKRALEQLSRKRAFVQNRVEDDEDKAPDFSREEAYAFIGPRQTIRFDQALWEKRAREWSNIFRQFPDIQQSSVSVTAHLVHKYLINSEGTVTRQPSVLVSVGVGATTQAIDGMRLSHFLPFYVTDLDQLPPPDEISRRVRQMAEDLTNLRIAPLLDTNYNGPVLLTGQASAEMFSQFLAPNLSGQRPPLAEQEQMRAAAAFSRSELAERLNQRVLPNFLSVFDDPKEQLKDGRTLIGAYDVDDQGVPARRVSLIEQGVLKNLLMSRRPRKGLLHSNGHGRSSLFGGASAQSGNLFIQASNGKSYEELKKQLMEMCRSQNLPWGILIKALNESGGGEGARGMTLSAPFLLYKVHVQDGREELIRGAAVSVSSIRALRDIAAAGNDAYILNRISSEAPSLLGSSIAPRSIIAPSVLIEEMDVKRSAASQQKPAIITHPYFNK